MRWILLPLAAACLSAGRCAAALDSGSVIQFSTEFVDVCHFQADEEACLKSLGPLFFSGGIEITANSTHFGGLSSLLVSFDARRFGSVTDAGWLVTGDLDWHMSWLDGVTNGKIGPLLGLDGEELGARGDGNLALWDAESVAALNTTHPFQGDLLVSFERQHRVWRYKFGSEGHRAIPSKVAGLTLQDHDKIGQCPENGGGEAMELLRDGRIMVLCEHSFAQPDVQAVVEQEGDQLSEEVGEVLGWVVGPDGSAQEMRYLTHGGLAPVALARLPASDDLLVLERKWSSEEGNTLRVRHITERDYLQALVGGCVVNPGLVAELNAQLHNVDNFEGIAVVPGFPRHRRPIFPTRRSIGEDRFVFESDAERLEVLLVSDNNFAASQRTLLMSFHVNRTILPPSECISVPSRGWAIGGVAILVAVPALSVCVCFVFVVIQRRAEKSGQLSWVTDIFHGDQRFEKIDDARQRHSDGTELT